MYVLLYSSFVVFSLMRTINHVYDTYSTDRKTPCSRFTVAVKFYFLVYLFWVFLFPFNSCNFTLIENFSFLNIRIVILFWLGVLVWIVFNFVKTYKMPLVSSNMQWELLWRKFLKIVWVCDLSIIFFFMCEALRETLIRV